MFTLDDNCVTFSHSYDISLETLADWIDWKPCLPYFPCYKPQLHPKCEKSHHGFLVFTGFEVWYSGSICYCKYSNFPHLVNLNLSCEFICQILVCDAWNIISLTKIRRTPRTLVRLLAFRRRPHEANLPECNDFQNKRSSQLMQFGHTFQRKTIKFSWMEHHQEQTPKNRKMEKITTGNIHHSEKRAGHSSSSSGCDCVCLFPYQ